MPRPSKHVSPDTLGGRIRAAREHLQLSLAEVADGHYSTSLLSQIERNKVEPSEESLRFLAERLHISFEDLETLAQQHRSIESEAYPYKSCEELRIEAQQYLTYKEFAQAIDLLHDLYLPGLPPSHRWRLAALRGHCYFEQRKFLKALQDLMYAASEQPKLEGLPVEQKQEVILLHLHLAATFRELRQFHDAQEHYQETLHLIDQDTPFGHVAEVHWGISLVTFAQSHSAIRHNNSQHEHCLETCREAKLYKALEHAEYAHYLYRAINEHLRAASVTCHIALIEQALGHMNKVRACLQEVLATWSSTLQEPPATSAAEKSYQQEAASVVSTAACSLAGIELEAQQYEAARSYVELALEAAQRSYRLRRADAYLMQGRILEIINPYDPAVEEAFRNAAHVLEGTHRIAARISAHVRLGHHLLKIGKIAESEQELEEARFLSDFVSIHGHPPTTEDSFLA